MKMPPNQSFSLSTVPLEPVSRTYQYRKVMKPLLERKRRARINRCLDELKELMTGTFQNEGENVAKLEKADILELTVRHLHNLRDKNSLFIRQNNHQKQEQLLNNDRFWDGFRQCAGEVSEFLSKFDTKISIDLLSHINGYRRNLENIQPIVTTNTNNHTTTICKSSSSPPLSSSSSLSTIKYSNRIPSVQSSISPLTHTIQQQQHQTNNFNGIYPEVFYLNSYHYQNKNIYSNDIQEKLQKFPQQFYHHQNDMVLENVWRPW